MLYPLSYGRATDMSIPDPRQVAHTAQQPRCVRCRMRHRPDLPCWKGAHAARVTFAVLALSQTCWICRGTATEVDHLQPRSMGGDDELTNCRPACRSCNARRGTTANPFDSEQPTPPAGVPLSPRWQTTKGTTP